MNSTILRGQRPAYSKFLIGLLLSAFAAIALSLWQAPGASAESAYPPPVSCSVNALVTPNNGVKDVVPGQTVPVTGSGFVAGSTVALTFASGTAGSTTASAAGTFSTTITLPNSLTVGSHAVQAKSGDTVCTDPNLVYKSATASNSVSTSTGGLAFTGFQAITAGTIGALIVLAGLMFLLVGRRRKA